MASGSPGCKSKCSQPQLVTVISVVPSAQEAARYIQNLADTEPVYESPININIAKTIEIELPPLIWHNLELPPKKMKITNTGYTCKEMGLLTDVLFFHRLPS